MIFEGAMSHRDLKPSNTTTERTQAANDPQGGELLVSAGLGGGLISHRYLTDISPTSRRHAGSAEGSIGPAGLAGWP